MQVDSGAVSRDSLLKAFSGLNHQLDSEGELVKKCMDACQDLGLSASDLVLKWEVYSDMRGLDGPPKPEQIEAIKREAMRDMQSKSSKKDVGAQRGSNKVYNKGSLGSLASSLSDNYGSKVAARIKAEAPPSTPSSSRSGAPTTPGGGYVTPMKRKVPETPSSALGGGSRMRALPSTPQTDMAMQESSPEAASYHKREQRLKVHSTFNEALPASLGSTVPRPSGARVEISAVKAARPEHYMYDRVENKVNMLKDRLKDVVDGIVANARLKENAGEEGFSFTPVNAASQERVWCCGRVVAEGDAASLNATSVMIEGANGRRVKLDMSNVPEFAMFPGQIIVVNGHNGTGQLIKVLSIYYDASLPMPKTPASQIALFNETEAYLGGNPLSVFTAAGPFTTSADLSYKPLDELLEHIVAESPDVMILCGPFVDCKHRLLDPNCAGQPGGFSNGTPPDTTTIMRTLMRDRISKALQGTHITCIIVPSPNDIHARPLFPQPAFSPEVIKGDGVSDRDLPVVLMSNPCTFKINEVVVQVATQDVLVHMSGSEASKMTGDRMSRLGRHLIQQRSIYPLFPYAEGAQISATLADGLTLPCSPDVLIVPSNLVPFAKRCGETLLLNPGRLVKGNTAGTFSRMTIHPILKNIRTGGGRVMAGPPVLSPSGSPSGEAAGVRSGFGEVVPTELSSEFAAAEGSEAPKEAAAEGSEAPKEAASEGSEAPKEAVAEGSEAPMEAAAEGSEAPKEDVVMGEAAAEAGPEKAVESNSAMGESVHGEVCHRVVERTRVDIVRI